MNPTSNSELMAQMSQIGQLQANSELQDMLRGMAAQNQLGSAGSMLGKIVRGTDDQNNPVEGLVTSLRVEDNKVYLELDNGNTLSLDRVTYVAPGISANTSAAGTPVAA